MYLSEKVIHRPGSTQYGISGQIGFYLLLSERFIHLTLGKLIVFGNPFSSPFIGEVHSSQMTGGDKMVARFMFSSPFIGEVHSSICREYGVPLATMFSSPFIGEVHSSTPSNRALSLTMLFSSPFIGEVHSSQLATEYAI